MAYHESTAGPDRANWADLPDQSFTDTYWGIFDNPHTPMLLIDPKSGEIVDANKAATAFYGYSRAQFVTMRIMDLNALPENEVRVRMRSATDGETSLFHFSHRMASGELRDVEVHSGPITVKGRSLLFSIIHDISARKQAEIALREAHDEMEKRVAERTASLQASEERYRSLFDHSIDGVLLTTPEGEILAANPAACHIFGMTRDELLAKGRDRVLDGDDPRVGAFLAERDATGRASGEVRAIHADGTVFPIEASSALFEDGNGNSRTCVIIRDVRDRKEMEQRLLQAQKMEAVGLLASSVAHDFSNLLSAITVYGQLVADARDVPETVHTCAHRILRTAERGVAMTRELLNFSRRSKATDDIVSANIAVQNVAGMVKTTLPAGVALITDLDSELPSFIGDASKIEQVLINLIINARDAMPEGGNILLATALVESSQEIFDSSTGAWATITVSDEGHGIPEETKKQMFSPFFTTKEQGKGTGLGLYIVDGIVKQHKGHVRVVSEPGKGSSFTLYFPAVPLKNKKTETAAPSSTCMSRAAGLKSSRP